MESANLLLRDSSREEFGVKGREAKGREAKVCCKSSGS